MGEAIFVRTQAPSRIPGMISMSNAGAVNLKVLGPMQAKTRWSQRGGAFYSGTPPSKSGMWLSPLFSHPSLPIDSTQ